MTQALGRHPRARWALTALIALGACRTGSPERAPSPGGSGFSPAAVSLPPTLLASAAAPDASASGALPAASAAAADAGVETLPAAEAYAATAGLDEASLERRIFRQVLVGALVYPPKRLTWVLFRGATVARLQLFCQSGERTGVLGIRLTGKENEETTWGAPVRTDYAGTRVSERPLSYRLAVASGPVGATGCENVPSVLVLSCRPESISALRAGAALIVGRKGPDDEMPPWHWQPRERERIAALRCDFSVEGNAERWPSFLAHVWTDWPLVFAAGKGGSPGIEWAHENSDMVVQEGAYRWMPSR